MACAFLLGLVAGPSGTCQNKKDMRGLGVAGLGISGVGLPSFLLIQSPDTTLALSRDCARTSTKSPKDR